MHRRRLLRLAKQVLPQREGLPRAPHSLPLEMARVAQWFHAASNTTRISILEFLSFQERSVSELQHILDAPQPSISFHLRVLRESGLVRERREGRWKYYSLRGDTLQYMMAFTQIVSPGRHTGTCALSCCR